MKKKRPNTHYATISSPQYQQYQLALKSSILIGFRNKKSRTLNIEVIYPSSTSIRGKISSATQERRVQQHHLDWKHRVLRPVTSSVAHRTYMMEGRLCRYRSPLSRLGKTIDD